MIVKVEYEHKLLIMGCDCFVLSFSVASPVCQQHQTEGQPMGKEEGWSHYQLALYLVYCGLAAYACTRYLCEKGHVLSKQPREWSQDWMIQTLCWIDPTRDQWKCKLKKKKKKRWPADYNDRQLWQLVLFCCGSTEQILIWQPLTQRLSWEVESAFH